MKPNMFVRFAVWLVDESASQNEMKYLTGDLLEELQAGRSMSWFGYQIFSALLIRIRALAFRYTLLLAFSAAWSLLYPAWMAAFAKGLHYATHATYADWPWSSLVPVISAILPASVFIWLGFVAYTTMRGTIRSIPIGHLILVLSFSSSMLLTMSLIVLRQIRYPEMVVTDMVQPNFFQFDHLSRISIPLSLSLMFALLFSPQKRYDKGSFGPRKWTVVGPLMSRIAQSIGLVMSLLFLLPIQTLGQTTIPTVAANPTAQHVQVAEGVSLEVLDWGGTGRPLVFLAGLGNTAHTFDKFAPQFTRKYHVYGITRRGFGTSSRPAPTLENYSADRLGDDVLAVLNSLKLDRAVLVGHSLAGEELSSLASRHPERIVGLIYLEAGYGYAFYDRVHGDPIFDFFQLSRLFNEYSTNSVTDPDHFTQNLTNAVSLFDKDLKESNAQDPTVPFMHAPRGPADPIVTAINLGGKEYTKIPVPVLAIYACPHNFDFEKDPKLRAALVADSRFYCSRQADAFAAGVPTARVVRIPNTDHYVFRSNNEQVVQEMNAFLNSLTY